MSETILVTGATGRVGAELVRLLIVKGESLRAAARNPSAAAAGLPRMSEAVEFDFDRPETFAHSLRGAGKVFLIARPGDNRSDEVAIPFIDTARGQGVKLIVSLTAMGVEQDDSFMLRLLEKYVEKSGIPYVHLRPNWFMQNFGSGPMLADMLGTGALHLPASDAKISFIDTRDIAAVAAAALTEPRHAGKAYTLTGGEALDHYEAVGILSRAAGRTIGYVPLSEEVACAALSKAGIAKDLIDRWTFFYRKVRQGLCAPITGDVETILGRSAITFEKYANDHAASWRQGN
jgi:uncharacterized protein YbjT (DUF2867 family)